MQAKSGTLRFRAPCDELSQGHWGEHVQCFGIMSASVSAGCGFDQVLFRESVLNALAQRADANPITMFVNAIVRADRLGIPIANALQTQVTSIKQYCH